MSAEKISGFGNSENFLPEISVDQLILETENSEPENYSKKIAKIEKNFQNLKNEFPESFLKILENLPSAKKILILNNSILKIYNSPNLQKIIGFANGLSIPDFLKTRNSQIGFLAAKFFEKILNSIFEKPKK